MGTPRKMSDTPLPPPSSSPPDEVPLPPPSHAATFTNGIIPPPPKGDPGSVPPPPSGAPPIGDTEILGRSRSNDSRGISTTRSAFGSDAEHVTFRTRVIGTLQDWWVQFWVLMDRIWAWIVDIFNKLVCVQKIPPPPPEEEYIPPPPNYPPPFRIAYNAFFSPMPVRGKMPSESSLNSSFQSSVRMYRASNRNSLLEEGKQNPDAMTSKSSSQSRSSRNVSSQTRKASKRDSHAPRVTIESLNRDEVRGTTSSGTLAPNTSKSRPPLSVVSTAKHNTRDDSVPLPPPPPRGFLQKFDALMVSQNFHVDPDLELDDDDISTIPPPPPEKEFQLGLSESFMLPSKHAEERPYITLFLVFLCVIMFIVEIAANGGFAPLSDNPMLGPSGQTLIDVGAKYGPNIFEQNQYYRLFVPILLHAGLLHLALNLSAFRSLAYPMEKNFGHLKILVIFIWGGYFGLCLSTLFAPESIGIGASGGLFALFGGTWGDLIQNWKLYGDEAWKVFRKLFLMTLVNAVIGLVPYIDNFAHMGGLIFGVFCGLAFFVERTIDRYGRLKKRKNRQILIQLFAIFMIPAMLVTATVAIIEVGAIECSWCSAISCLPTGWWPCGPPNPCYAKGTFTFATWFFSNQTVILSCPLGEPSIVIPEYSTNNGSVPWWLDPAYANEKNYTRSDEMEIVNSLCLEFCGY